MIVFTSNDENDDYKISSGPHKFSVINPTQLNFIQFLENAKKAVGNQGYFPPAASNSQLNLSATVLLSQPSCLKLSTQTTRPEAVT